MRRAKDPPFLFVVGELVMSEPSWVDTARSLIGTHEGIGSDDNPTILEWAQELGGWTASYYKHDEIPWCGLFVGYCLHENDVTPPNGLLAANSYAAWGTKCDPKQGAILVFTRQGGGHVGFYVAEDDDAYHVLGGNQSDAVNITRVAKNRLSACRWPAGVDQDDAEAVTSSADGNLSKNEQ
jgi:uncharacterized protein (TIGR02594 family)